MTHPYENNMPVYDSLIKNKTKGEPFLVEFIEDYDSNTVQFKSGDRVVVMEYNHVMSGIMRTEWFVVPCEYNDNVLYKRHKWSGTIKDYPRAYKTAKMCLRKLYLKKVPASNNLAIQGMKEDTLF